MKIKHISILKKILLFAVLPLFLLLIIGHFFFDKPEPSTPPTGAEITDCERKFASRYTVEPYYTGELFDSHFHIPPAPGIRTFFIKQPVLGKTITLNEIMCRLEKEDVRGAIGFYLPKKTNTLSLPQAQEIEEYAKDRLDLFISPIYISSDELEKVLAEHKGLFVGIGEMGFYEFTRFFRPLDGKWAARVFQIAEKYNLPVMFHPGRNQRDQVEQVLKKNPNVTFILHGHEAQEYITELMDKYPNVYYTVDGAVLYAMRGKMVRGKKEEFLADFERDFNMLLNDGVEFWKDNIEKHPDRFMLGTDRGAIWNYDEEMSIMTEEFSRAFIGRLDPAVQENFAYKNAERVLKKAASSSSQ